MSSLRKRPPSEPEPVDDVPPVEAVIEPSGDPVMTDLPAEALAKAEAPEPADDDPTAHLLRQIHGVRQAEELQKQRAAAIAQNQQRRIQWLVDHPTARGRINELGVLHKAAIEGGLTDCSPSYFEFLEEQLEQIEQQQPAAAAEQVVEDVQQRIERERQPEPPPRMPSRGSVVSAPVSRQGPAVAGYARNGSITLTPQQVEAANMAGVTPGEYARQLRRYNEMKASGEYSERRE